MSKKTTKRAVLTASIVTAICASAVFVSASFKPLPAEADTQSDLSVQEDHPALTEEEVQPEQPAEEEDQPDGNAAVTLYGTPLPADKLSEFTYDYEGSEYYTDAWGPAELFEENGLAPFKELFARGLCLIGDIDEIGITSAAERGEDSPYIEVPIKEGEFEYTGTYYETGYTYESFYRAYTSVFTDDLMRRILESTPHAVYNYGGELWFMPLTITPDISIVNSVYEIVSQSDTRIELKRTDYHVGIGEDLVYDPEKKDEYRVSEKTFIFVNTNSGWRIADCPLMTW